VLAVLVSEKFRGRGYAGDGGGDRVGTASSAVGVKVLAVATPEALVVAVVVAVPLAKVRWLPCSAP